MFQRADSWADRKLSALKAAGQSTTKPYVFMTSCVGAEGKDIDAMQEGQIEVSLRTLRKYCDTSKFEEEMGYVRDSRQGPTLKRDWHVSYWKSTYKGCPCYFIDHSRIEYIYVKADEWEPAWTPPKEIS